MAVLVRDLTDLHKNPKWYEVGYVHTSDPDEQPEIMARFRSYKDATNYAHQKAQEVAVESIVIR